jgi:hypothetical protein
MFSESKKNCNLYAVVDACATDPLAVAPYAPPAGYDIWLRSCPTDSVRQLVVVVMLLAALYVVGGSVVQLEGEKDISKKRSVVALVV